MLSEIYHVGLTVSDLAESLHFYRDILGLSYIGSLTMTGPETDRLFGRPGCRAEVAYLAGKDALSSPPVELISFPGQDVRPKKADLFSVSVSEVCFRTSDLWGEYERLKKQGVEFLSEPQPFDFTADGFGKSLAVYLRDPDGIILELMQPLP